MNRRRYAAALFIFSLLNIAAASAEDGREAEIRAATQAMLDAVAPGDKTVWEKHLHRDFSRLDENGAVMAGPALIEEIRPLPQGLEGRMEIEDFAVTRAGTTLIATYRIQEYLDYHGQPLRSRFRSMDVWVETPEGMRLIGQHVAAELKDPPAISVPQETLCAYEGVYRLAEGIETTIACTDKGLHAERADRPRADYLAETDSVFFVPGRPRTRRIFLRDENGEVAAFVDRREGEDVKWRKVE